ncbi:hypothetical protein D9758_010533 [Tetrapyrgos nigripes]|uniref:Uncharacterized protein n=1 Tax=Tetrapyrgos nigripes TaxID=182062 RepID=A0A8H5FVV6_9AGAR|nr:hypothetical protein D9758_010533 [Tetrapyrgos nigripes]
MSEEGGVGILWEDGIYALDFFYTLLSRVMSSVSPPSLAQSSENSTYLFAVARLFHTRRAVEPAALLDSRELTLRTPTRRYRPLHSFHPYRRARYIYHAPTVSTVSDEDLNRFLEAIALLAVNEDHEPVAPEPQPPQPRWYVKVFDYIITLPVKIRETRAAQFVFPTANNQ